MHDVSMNNDLSFLFNFHQWPFSADQWRPFLNFHRYFQQETRGQKHLIIQVQEGDILPIMLGAWGNGWRISFLRWDSPFSKFITENSESFLRLSNAELVQDLCSLQFHHGEQSWPAHDNDLLSQSQSQSQSQSLSLSLPLAAQEYQQSFYLWGIDEWAMTFFTSGSTNRPKGVCHSLSNLLHSTKVFCQYLGLDINDSYCSLSALHTIGGIRFLIYPLFSGAKSYSMPIRGPEQFIKYITRVMALRPTFILAGPGFVKLLAGYGPHLQGFFRVCALLLVEVPS